ncbi:hypothetical protein MIND_00854600 [Mycena indigotica]|uniref:MARVEL domain-containing protein n=1 Tax=Mycena indigotica TaxID=2126181 RepID=A0A8H6SHI4_9AGAR|nr:uncharacterized protein MIND_00854600 [Mycena indigotica]KAF7299063.1 hypothetical protein MIND_00854600 [Mycena indigotica]
MPFDLPTLRKIAYGVFAFFSFVVFCLTIARLAYTNNLPRGDPLNRGGGTSMARPRHASLRHPVYLLHLPDPDIVELLVTSMMSMAWASFLIYTIHKRVEGNLVSTFRGELVGLAIIWLFWIVGTSIATTFWGNLGFCSEFEACRVLSAIVAFSWLAWLTLTLISGVSVTFIIANGALLEPLHGQWIPALPRDLETGSQYTERNPRSRPVSTGA